MHVYWAQEKLISGEYSLIVITIDICSWSNFVCFAGRDGHGWADCLWVKRFISDDCVSLSRNRPFFDYESVGKRGRVVGRAKKHTFEFKFRQSTTRSTDSDLQESI